MVIATILAGLALAPQFTGAGACAGCHAEIYEKQTKTHHSAALRKGADGRWNFGAGAQATTYVSQVDDDHYLEHGLSWYRKLNGLAVTPGHTGKSGVKYRTFSPEAEILRCFQCHSTGDLTVDASRTITPAETGVRCEACHGAGARHDGLKNPAKMTGAQINDLCGQCHRKPAGEGVAVDWRNAWNTRHEPVYFSQSACFKASGGSFSCITCHSAHEDNVEARCGECHKDVKHRAEVKGACVDCHMPKVDPSPLLRFTNHWIGIYGADPLRPLAK